MRDALLMPRHCIDRKPLHGCRPISGIELGTPNIFVHCFNPFEQSSAFVTWEQVFHDAEVTRNPNSNNKLRATLYWKQLLEAMHFLLEYLSNSFAGTLLIACFSSRGSREARYEDATTECES